MRIAALVSWLLTESAGAFMLRSWIVSGGLRRRSGHVDGMSLPVVFGHVGLAATGLTCWVIFLATSSTVPAVLAVAVLAPAIDLGISTLTVWTTFPARSPGEPTAPVGPVSDEAITRALADERLTERLVDHIVAGLLVARPERDRGTRQRAQVLIPAAHGMLAIVTFLLVILAIVSAVS